MLRTIEDIKTVFRRDPAAKNIFEVLLCYPGLHALWAHRIAHIFYRLKLYTIARLISHINRWLTGIEIHPGARIGRRTFIDHGMGVVIGETTIIGCDCLIYKGVVLGGTTLEKTKRHPTLEDNVVIGSNACVLGNICIGHDSRIGSGSVVVKDVKPNSTVVGIPGRVVGESSQTVITDLDHGKLPDPVADAIKLMLRECDCLERKIEELQKNMGTLEKKDEELEELKKMIKKEFRIEDNK